LAVEAASLAARCRHRFPIFERQVYINSCSQGALSDSVRAAYEQYLEDWDDKGAPWDYWVERQEAARTAFAGLVNAGADEIAVTTSLSAGVSTLASGLRFTQRSKVVLTDWEFPTIGQIWHAQEARGARVMHVKAADDGTIPIEHFERAIDDDTLIVALTHVCYRNGAMLDVPAVVELAHERGALVLLDAFQAIGSLPVDVAELGVDFLGAGVLKYLLGSAGSDSSTAAETSSNVCGRRKPAGSPTRTSSPWITPTIRRRTPPRASNRARRRSLRSTRASQASS